MTLLRSDRTMTGCRPLSLTSMQTTNAGGQEVGMALDRRRFRANIDVDLDPHLWLAEDALIGRSRTSLAAAAR